MYAHRLMLLSDSTRFYEEFMWKQGAHALSIRIQYIHNVYTSVHFILC